MGSFWLTTYAVLAPYLIIFVGLLVVFILLFNILLRCTEYEIQGEGTFSHFAAFISSAAADHQTYGKLNLWDLPGVKFLFSKS